MDNTCCATWAPRLTSLIRIGSGYMLLLHGTTKLLGIPESPMSGTALFSLYGIAGLIELVAGALLLIGLFTRCTAFVATGFGAAAYLIGHVASKGFFFLPMFNGGEAALLYSFVFFLLFLYGPGPWSIDAMIRKQD